MKIGLIGYGKMGKAIEEIAVHRGHEVALKITTSNLDDFNRENLKNVDVAIEFTNPNVALGNLEKLLDNHIPTVCGSTGWLEHLPELTEMIKANNGSFLYASNFSIGVNLFFELNQYLAKLMNGYAEYNVEVEEIHHTAKKDAPSGTAITIAEQILKLLSRKKNWVKDTEKSPQDLAIISKRIDPAPGTHIVKYTSEIDDIEIMHTAHSRKGFALGAVLAAEFIYGKKGIFTMKEVLGINSSE